MRALAAVSVLASAARLEALPDLAPVMREIRRVAPAVGWSLSEDEPAPRRTAATPRPPCPPGQEPVAPPAPPADAPAVAEAPSTDATTREPARDAATTRERASRRGPSSTASTAPRRARRRAAPAVVCRAVEVARDVHTHDPVVVLERNVRVVHPRLLELLAQVTAHFPGRRVEVVSGYRPSANPHAGSRHAHARALDFRLAGVSREALRDYARTLPRAGVGYYPNSVFTHLDVRDADEGAARWTDYSGPGERARYGHWPPRADDVAREGDYAVEQATRALEALARAELARADLRARRRDRGARDEDGGDQERDESPHARTDEPAPRTATAPAFARRDDTATDDAREGGSTRDRAQEHERDAAAIEDDAPSNNEASATH